MLFRSLGHFSISRCFVLGDTVCILQTAKLLDKELTPRYNLTLRAVDAGIPALSSSLAVIINVIDANDHNPIFREPSYTATVSELSPINSFVAALTATDEDEGKAPTSPRFIFYHLLTLGPVVMSSV